MDITKYIGQFILKNKFCYIHGLGNLELVKRGGSHDGKSLQAPTYEVILTAGGSIDDSFANFIATNEQISISKAANALRDFSIQSRKDLEEGKEVPVEGLGRFKQEGNGRLRFLTDDNFNFSPAGMPALKNSKQLEEKKNTVPHEPTFPPPTSANSINWSMVIIAAILLVILGAGGYGFYYYKSQQKETVPVPLPVKDTIIAAPPPVVAVDTTHKDSVALSSVVDTNLVITYQLLVGDYTARDKAEKQLRRLKINGHKVDLVTTDSVNYKLLETVNCRALDTAHVIDSMQRFFGYKNVIVYK